jgi:hypothetical protein
VRHLNSEVAAGAIEDEGAWLGELRRDLFALLAGVFAQARSRLAAFARVRTEPGNREACYGEQPESSRGGANTRLICSAT